MWLEGDNHENSTDSHGYGPVPYGLLRSKVIYKVNTIRFSSRLGVLYMYINNMEKRDALYRGYWLK